MSAITITRRSPKLPPDYTPSHHVGGSPPVSFRNPWPSAGDRKQSLLGALRVRFGNNKLKNHVPTPSDRKGLPTIVKPDWGAGVDAGAMKVTWIGHASFLVEMPASTTATTTRPTRGVRILLDPVFSSNMSPFSFGGPERISPPPCEMEDLPDVDVVLISHDHYDHLDVTTIKFINERGNGNVRYLCGLGVGKHLMSMGVKTEHVMEMDWWDGVSLDVQGAGGVDLTCTPSQHFSGRWWNDHGHGLWCSWVLEAGNVSGQQPVMNERKKLFFAGDTGYRYKAEGTSPDDYDKLAACPAFKQIGNLYGPFDLALLPIGCYAPRYSMSPIHCAPEDSICIHGDVQSKKSIGMHYGTVRGNISVFYEDAAEPPVLWQQECEKAGLKWDHDVGLCDIGQTVVV